MKYITEYRDAGRVREVLDGFSASPRAPGD